MSLVFDDNLAFAFSVNVELIAARAYSGEVCFGNAFAVYCDFFKLFRVSSILVPFAAALSCLLQLSY